MPTRRAWITTRCFGFEIRALLANTHPLVAKPHLVAQDFADQTIITYLVPDEMLDLIRQVLEPAGVRPPRRTTELTVAMLQLVASGRRGGAAAVGGAELSGPGM